MSEEKKELTKKLYQIQKWFFENRNVLTENEITVVYAFADKSKSQLSVFSGGKGSEIAACVVGVANELMQDMENEEDLHHCFNLIAGKIVERYRELTGDDEDEENEEE